MKTGVGAAGSADVSVLNINEEW